MNVTSRWVRGLLVVALAFATARAQAPGPTPVQAPADPALERDRRLLDTYRDMLSQEPAQEYAYRRLLETAHAVGGVVGLIALYKDAVAKAPNDYAAWLVLGNLQRTADNHDAAVEAFTKAAALKPDKPEPHLLRALLERDGRGFAEAFAAFDRAVKLAKERDLKQEILRAAGETAVEAKDLARAEAYFDALADTEPQNLFLRMQAAASLGRLAEPALSLAKWQAIEAKAGGQLQHLVVVWKEIAELQTQLGRLADAEATWRKGLERLPAGHYERRTFIDGLIAVHRREDRLRPLIAELEPMAASDVEVTLALARLHEELAEDDKALSWYREAQKKRPSDEEPRMAALRILERIGRPEDVLAAWVEVVRAFPREPRHEMKLAELYYQLGKPKEAAELLRKMSRSYPSDPGVHGRLIELWLRYGDKAARAEVENEYKILLKLEPDEPTHVTSLGEFYWSTDDKARADATWKRLLRMGQSPGEGHFLLGETLAEHDRDAEAEAELAQALALEPDNGRFARALAAHYEKQGKDALALEAWTKIGDRAARATPETREAREHIIQLWERGRRLDEAIGGLQKRFGATPPDLDAGRFLAVALTRLGRFPEARAVLERMDQLAPDDLETLLGMEQVYSRTSEPRLAIGVLERLAKASPRAAVEYLTRAAELSLDLGDEAGALKAAKQVVDLAPADARAHGRVGDLYARMGYRSEAAEAWRQALTLDPRDFQVRFKLASLYRDMGNPAREEQVLAEIVREGTDGADILRAGRRLLQLALATGRLAEIEAQLRPLIESGRGSGGGRPAQLRLVVDVYGHLAQAIRYSEVPRAGRDKALAELGERALRPLLEALEDNDVATRARAIETLELTHPPGATPALARLAAEPESMAQVEALSALGHIATAGAVAALARLGAAQQAGTRELAIWALGFAATSEAVAVLTDRARHGSPRDRQLVAAALGLSRHPDALPIVLELARDRTPEVREIGTWALARLRTPQATAELAERLSRALTGREAQLAAWGLGRNAADGDGAARAALIERLWIGTPNAADDAIWTALAYPDLDRAREDEIVESGYAALVLRDRGALQPLKPNLYLPEPPERAPRPDALASLLVPDGPIAARVRAILERPEAEPRLALAETLTSWGHAGDAKGELTLVPARFGDWREATAAMLAGLAPSIVDLLERADGRVRDAWLEVMARWPEPMPEPERVRAVALDALAGSEVRGALATLAGLGAPAARDQLQPVLGRVLASPSPDVRAGLGRMLAAWGDAASQAMLVELVQDPVPYVRIAVAQAIAERKLAVSAALVDDLFDLVRDPLPDVSVAAVQALIAQGRAQIEQRLAADPTPHVQRALRDRR